LGVADEEKLIAAEEGIALASGSLAFPVRQVCHFQSAGVCNVLEQRDFPHILKNRP